MKKSNKLVLCWILTPILVIVLSTLYNIKKIPNTIFVREGKELKGSYFLQLTKDKDIKVSSLSTASINNDKANVSIFGLVPIKSVSIKTIPDEIMLYPGGQPVGVKLNTKGVLVVALSDVQSDKGKVSSPAAMAGVEIGDSIIKINDAEVNNSEELAKEINNFKGEEIILSIDRKGTILIKKVKPVKNATDNNYKVGLWVRDSTAGVGTLTFYDDKTNKFAALGHPITDVDTGTILNVNSGQLVTSSIVSVRKGMRGNPGELKGIFVNEDTNLGEISKNTECGIFGTGNDALINKKANKPLRIALRDEIKVGPAKILTTVDGNEPKYYDINIDKLLTQDEPGPKSMVIRVTDPKLLEKTGGIVQGMSGSPIIQDNKIVGAVTHVLINKPEVGYGIYIEWMLKDAEILSK